MNISWEEIDNNTAVFPKLLGQTNETDVYLYKRIKTVIAVKSIFTADLNKCKLQLIL